jgi:hypothetical protein
MYDCPQLTIDKENACRNAWAAMGLMIEKKKAQKIKEILPCMHACLLACYGYMSTLDKTKIAIKNVESGMVLLFNSSLSLSSG